MLLKGVAIKGLMRRMLTDWKVKTFGQKCLGLLPGDLSLRANEFIIGRLRGGGPDRVDFGSRVNKGLANLELVCSQFGTELVEATVLEIGTGWHGVDLVLFYLAGAQQVYTVDRFGFLTDRALARTITGVYKLVEEGGLSSERRSLLDPDRVSRLGNLARANTGPRSLFDELDIRPIVAPTNRWRCISVPSQTVDLFYSESVLQRLPTEDLDRVLAASAESWLDEKGVFFHRTDQKDIHSQSHVDGNRWALEYLKYPDWFFDAFLNGQLIYQNRLRESDFLDLFERNGLQVDYVESLCRREDIQRIREMDLPARFEGYSASDLATRSSRFLGHLAQSEEDGEIVRETVDVDDFGA